MNILSMKPYNSSIRTLSLFIIFSLALLMVHSCGDGPTGISYENAPPLPDTTKDAVRTIRSEDGLSIYVIDEGGENDPFEVTPNDEIRVNYTGRRADDGEIFESTYINDYESPRVFRNLTPDNKQTGNGMAGPLIDGFRRGLLGMKMGERRVIVIPPELGYGDQEGHRLQEETLIFDVELLQILN